MPPLIYCRIVGHAATLAMHSINSAVMWTSMQDEIIMKDPEIQVMVSMQGRFLTVWNILFQLIYSSLALTCDVLTVTNRDHLLPKSIKKIRDFYFSSTIFPGTLLVFTMFWPLYLYDRNIIFPEFIDKIFSQKSNYVMHMGIVPAVMWELAFQPRQRPKSHKPYLIVLILYFTIYNGFVLYTYQQRGLWPYPLMGMVYGTVYNVIFHAYALLLLLGVYYMQWSLHSLFWGQENRKQKKVKTK